MKINVNHLRLPAVVDAGVAVKHTALRVMQCDASSDVHIWCMAHTERDMQMSWERLLVVQVHVFFINQY